MNLDTFIATNRFGLGPDGTESQRIGSDPRGWLLAQLQKPYMPAEIASHGGPGSVGLKMYIEEIVGKKAKKNNPETMPQEKKGKEIRSLYLRQIGERFIAQQKSSQPLFERLVMFWSNHFTVSIQKPPITPLVCQFEAEAIRPHVTGRFVDMLKAVERHPAMLIYLDNVRSQGPNSPFGKRQSKGLNENLAREILELHTLGVGGGYTQEDVIALAKLITGWSIDRGEGGAAGGFIFRPNVHEPGPKTLLGKKYQDAGEREGLAALEDIARHPSTARHIATKLARHFIADAPPASAVDRLAQSFSASDGDLLAVYRTLVSLSECWTDPLAKFKTPYEYVLSAARLLGLKPQAERVTIALESVNYRVFSAPSPAGYADIASAWVSPDAIKKRIDWAKTVSVLVPPRIVPLELAAQSFGPVMREETRFAISGAASGADGIALLLSSPEFQRR